MRASSNRRFQICIVGEKVFATYPLPSRGSLIIGRSQKADIHVAEPSISRAHATLHLGSTIEIEDLGSANGTRVAGRRLAPGERARISPGESIDLGSVMVVVQPGGVADRPRRLWTHDTLEERLNTECAREAREDRARGSFAYVRLGIAGASPDPVQQTLVAALDPKHMLAGYGPGEFELLLLDTSADEAQAVVDHLAELLTEQGAQVRRGIACFPRDGSSPEALVARASRQLRPPASSDSGAEVVVLDAAMQRLHELSERIAAGTISVLLLGETGVGKEIFAELLHRRSPRASKPCLKLNCAALSETLLESELFGHEKGSFSGAVQTKQGLLETADEGTIFLDEVGEMPLSLQAKLLRVLEERKVTRVGGLKAKSINVRFIAATNRDLEQEVARGTFRQDLFYRLNGISLVIPPLRERVSEIEKLAQTFIARAARDLSRPTTPRLTDEALAMLRRYPWPGNIRELRNMMERAVLLAVDDTITLQQLPVQKMESTFAVAPPDPDPSSSDLAPIGTEAEVDRQRVIDALEKCAGNQTRAARLLGISRGTLVARLAAYQLPRPRKRISDGD